MKKIYFFTIIALIILSSGSISLFSCPGAYVGGRFNSIFPLGDESKYTKTGYGFDIYGGYQFPKCPFEYGINLRYINWPPKDTYPGVTYSVYSLDYYAYFDYDYEDDGCDFEPYVGIQLGVHNLMSSYSSSYYSQKSSISYGAYGLNLGTYYKLEKNIKLDLKLDYSKFTIKNVNSAGFSIGIGIRYLF
jgi:opacity protein-like surface antigen